MTVVQKTAYTWGMSWKDYLKPEERDELEQAEAAKKAAAAKYNAIRLTLKTRCDARMRRDPLSQNSVQKSRRGSENE